MIGIEIRAEDPLTVVLEQLIGLSNALLILVYRSQLQLNILLLSIAHNRQRRLIAGTHLPYLVDEDVLVLQILSAKLANDIAFPQAGLRSRAIGMHLHHANTISSLFEADTGVRSIDAQLSL